MKHEPTREQLEEVRRRLAEHGRHMLAETVHLAWDVIAPIVRAQVIEECAKVCDSAEWNEGPEYCAQRIREMAKEG